MAVKQLLVGAVFNCVSAAQLELQYAKQNLDISVERYIQSRAVQAVCDEYENTGDGFTLKIISMHNEMGLPEKIPPGEGIMEVGPLNAGRIRAVWISADTGVRSTIWFKADIRGQAWVVTRGLKRGERIADADVAYMPTNMARLSSGQSSLKRSPVGMVVTKTMKAGRIVSKESIAYPALVNRHDRVAINVNAGRVNIKAMGVAIGTGWMRGDTVSVMVDGAEAPVVAIVEGDKKVEVTF